MDIFEFDWVRPVAGFCWLEDAAKATDKHSAVLDVLPWRREHLDQFLDDPPWLVAVDWQQMEETSPLGSRGTEARRLGLLHREFAKIHLPKVVPNEDFWTLVSTRPKRTLSGIARFAGRHGSLDANAVELHLTNQDGSSGWTVGMSLYRWVEEIVTMRRLVRAWLAVVAGRADVLRPHVQWQERGAGWLVSWQHTDGISLVGDNLFVKWIPGSGHTGQPAAELPWPVGDVLGPARAWVFGQVNDTISGEGQSTGGVAFFLEPKDGRLRAQPATLRDALYVSLAQELAGAAKLKECEECRRTFPYQGRHAKYCSPRCRQRASRRRRQAGQGGVTRG